MENNLFLNVGSSTPQTINTQIVFFFFESNETKRLYFITFVYLSAFVIKTISGWLGLHFRRIEKKNEIHKTFSMCSLLWFEEKLYKHAKQLHILELCFYKKITQNSLCTANVQYTVLSTSWCGTLLEIFFT